MDEPTLQQVDTVDSTRWRALAATCLGVFMVAVSGTIVNPALPTIRADLGFSLDSVVWVVNGNLVAFGGLLVLCGRLGDSYGHRRVFLLGIVLFTAASLACGAADVPALFILGRVLQGVGTAAVWAVSLSLITQLFHTPSERARALAIYSCVGASGGSASLFLGGVVANSLGWHWLFLLNVPLGAIVLTVAWTLGFQADRGRRSVRLDVAGTVTITLSLVLTLLAVSSVERAGWQSIHTLVPLCGALALIALFLLIESRIEFPIISLALFRRRTLRVMVIVGALWSAAQYLWLFISALYLRLILGYDALQVGLAFLPATVAMIVFSLGLSARLVMHFGTRLPLTLGLLLVASGLMLLAAAPSTAHFATAVLPGMLLVGLGCGITYSPFLLSALRGISNSDYGLASGAVNSSMIVGGALALALIVGAANAQESHLVAGGASLLVARIKGYHLALATSATCALAAALMGAVLLRGSESSLSDC